MLEKLRKAYREAYDRAYFMVLALLPRKLLKDNRALANGQVMGGGVVGALIGIMVSLLIAIIIVMNLISSQTQAGWSAQANTTWTSLQTNIWVAITLLVIERWNSVSTLSNSDHSGRHDNSRLR